jgi:hypothetical protein
MPAHAGIDVAGYGDLAGRTGSDFDYLAIALRRATPARDSLPEQLLGRWLYLAVRTASTASRCA